MRILVVEDDTVLAAALTRALNQSAYAVDLVGDGEAANQALAGTNYDLVVLDIALPKVDGLSVLRRLRDRRSQIPVLILTARDTLEDRVAGLDLGADDYMTKPFDLPEFEARVRALIRRSQAVHSPVLAFGRLTLHTVAKRAQIDGEEIELTPREWGVLEYLLLRAGQVISKDQMLQALCGWDASLTHNTIEVYVSRLRAKLQTADIRIRTVRGFGYMVDDPDARSR